ncbi:MAG: A/G-specific adenine glycosylase [Bacteroidaceae bacterium]|nr:A/G-specific adenine glycosylase [Bacteroidaceae bacterium]
MADFAIKIEQWYKQHKRNLPWRETTNPYYIWLSEIILQQTRVEQGRGYYERFVNTFPTVQALAAASEEQVLLLWQGLGYYSRARNLHKAAQQIASLGSFPSDYKTILALPGVGPYTAAAIVSFAYEQPYAVLDGNVYRVLSRYFGIETPIDSTEGRKEFKTLADELLDKHHPALYNQAIMDFGALVCKPSGVDCALCPLCDTCFAYAQNRVQQLPVKDKKILQKTRWFSYVYVCDSEGNVLICRRTRNDIWKGLYEFFLVESLQELPLSSLQCKFPKGQWTLLKQGFIHQLTHQRLAVNFYKLELPKKDSSLQGFWVKKSELQNYALPQLLVKLMDNCCLADYFQTNSRPI